VSGDCDSTGFCWMLVLAVAALLRDQIPPILLEQPDCIAHGHICPPYLDSSTSRCTWTRRLPRLCTQWCSTGPTILEHSTQLLSKPQRPCQQALAAGGTNVASAMDFTYLRPPQTHKSSARASLRGISGSAGTLSTRYSPSVLELRRICGSMIGIHASAPLARRSCDVDSNFRRAMLRTSAVAAGVWTMTGPLSRGQGTSPNEKLNIAGIGVGGRGADNVSGVAGENLVALCDVDESRAGKTFERFPASETLPGLPQDAGRDARADRCRGDRYARSYACPGRRDGDETGQTLLLRETADAQRLRSAPDGHGGPREGSRHADGYPDPCRRQLPPRGRTDQVRRDRPGARSPCLAGRKLFRTRHADQHVPTRRARRPAAGSRGTGLGPVARSRCVPSVSLGLRAVQLALLVELCQRPTGRFLLPLLRRGLLGARSASSDDDRGARACASGERRALDDRSPAVSVARRFAAGDAALVQRRAVS
jgi:hypothetical protein